MHKTPTCKTLFQTKYLAFWGALLFIIILGKPAFSYTIKEATNIAATNLLQVANSHSTFRNIHLNITSKQSGTHDAISAEISSSLFLSFQKKTQGPKLEYASVMESDILVEGEYEKRGSVVYLDLNARFQRDKIVQFSATDVSFTFQQKKSRSLTALLELTSPFKDAQFIQKLNTQLYKQVKKEGYFKLLPQHQLQSFNLAQFRRETGCTAGDCAIQIGKRFGVDQVIFTSIHTTGLRTFLLSAQVFNVSDGTLHLSTTMEHRGHTGSIPQSLDRFSKQISDKNKAAHAMVEVTGKHFGKLNVTSIPKNAKIYLDGKLLQKRTNTLISDIPVGEHKIRVFKNNISNTKSFYLEPNETKQLSFKLEPLKIKTFAPSDNLKKSSLSPTFKVIFETVIDPSTITSKTIYLKKNKRLIPLKMRVIRNRLYIAPTQKLHYGSRYMLVITRKVKNVDGNSLYDPFYFQFNTLPYPKIKDQDVLIYSQTHEAESWTRKKRGKIHIGVTSFGTIKHIDINGVNIPTKDKTLFHHYQTYDFSKRKVAVYRVSVVSEQGTAKKKFVIHYGKKPAPKKSPLSLVTVLKGTQMDNVTSVTDSSTKKNAIKYALILVPSYTWTLPNNTTTSLKATLLREMYTDETYNEKEVSYTQVALNWKRKKSYVDTLQFTLGVNDIRLNNETYAQGDNKYQLEYFINSGFKENFGKTFNIGVDFEYKRSNSKVEVSDEDDNADATVYTLTTETNLKYWGTRNKLKIEYGINDAVGKYEDNSEYTFEFTQKIPLGDWKPSWKYKYKELENKIIDPRSNTDGVRTKNKTGTTTLKLGYKLLKSTVLALAYENKKQESNVEANNYENNSFIFSITNLF